MKKKLTYQSIGFLLFTIVFFLYWYFTTYVDKPLVWDEIVSLTNFVLVDINTTMTHYPDVNNHIFFNLLNNIYLKFIGVGDLYEAMDRIVTVRLFPMLIALSTITYTLLLSRKLFNNTTALMAGIILVTTLPYLNFALQLRGYTISTFFLIALLFHYLTYLDSKKWVHLALVTILSAGLLYSIPSNVFFFLAAGGVGGLIWLEDFLRCQKAGNIKEAFQSQSFYVLLALGFGAAISYVLYMPIVDDILNERHLQQMKGKSFYSYNVTELIPTVFVSLLSYRFLFLFPIAVALILFLRRSGRGFLANEKNRNVLILLLMFVVPFLISLIRGDKTPQRSMVPLSTLFAILSSTSIYVIFKDLKFLKGKGWILVTVVFAYSIFSYDLCRNHINDYLHKALLNGEKENSMMYNFYQSDEYDVTSLDALIEEARQTGYPIVMAKEIDRVSEGEYLLKHDMNYFATVWAKQAPAENEAGFQYQVLLELSQGKGKRPGYNRIGFPPQIDQKSGKLVPLVYYLIQNGEINQQDPRFYVLTFDSRWFENTMKKNFPEANYQRLNKRLSYHNMYRVNLR